MANDPEKIFEGFKYQYYCCAYLALKYLHDQELSEVSIERPHGEDFEIQLKSGIINIYQAKDRKKIYKRDLKCPKGVILLYSDKIENEPHLRKIVDELEIIPQKMDYFSTKNNFEGFIKNILDKVLDNVDLYYISKTIVGIIEDYVGKIVSPKDLVFHLENIDKQYSEHDKFPIEISRTFNYKYNPLKKIRDELIKVDKGITDE